MGAVTWSPDAKKFAYIGRLLVGAVHPKPTHRRQRRWDERNEDRTDDGPSGQPRMVPERAGNRL